MTFSLIQLIPVPNVTQAGIDKHYNRCKRLARHFLHRGNLETAAGNNNSAAVYLETAVGYIELAAQVAYTYMQRYADEELEELLAQVSQRLAPQPLTLTPTPNSLVFFDDFAMDNRGLSYQYLHALSEAGYDIHCIVPHQKAGELHKAYLKQANIPLHILNAPTTQGKMDQGMELLKTLQPAMLFLHLSPNDVLGCSLSLRVQGCRRYRINLTDHAFWLGTHVADAQFEFRRYGAWLSYHHRGIPLDTLLHMPYYPQTTEYPFQGFPTQVTPDKVLLFAGGSYYKFYSKDNRFLHLVRRILEAHPQALMLLAGDGDDAPLRAFIEAHQLHDRIILLGNRRDINAVFSRIDIFLNSYPMIGGLMSQLAAIHHKPIIGYTDTALYSFNDIEDLMGMPRQGKLVTDNETTLLERMHQLITDPEQRRIQAEYGTSALVTPATFNARLLSQLQTPQPMKASDIGDITVDLPTLADIYLDMDNRDARRYLFVTRPVKLLLMNVLQRLPFRKTTN
jgi:hypothetical protein